MDFDDFEKFYELTNSPKAPSQAKSQWTMFVDDEWLSQSSIPTYDILEMESPLYESSAFETTSTTSTAPNSPAESYENPIEMTDEDLIKLPVKELNKRLRSLPKNEALKLRKRRRSLKNRGYALNCRNKRLSENTDLQKQNTLLMKEIKDMTDKLSKITKERDVLKKKYDQINSIFSTMCTTSAMNQVKTTSLPQSN